MSEDVSNDDIFHGAYKFLSNDVTGGHYGIGINGCLPRRVYNTMRVNPKYIAVYWYVYQYQPVSYFNPDILGMRAQNAAAILTWLADYHIINRKRSDTRVSYRYPWIYSVNPEYVETIRNRFGEPIRYEGEPVKKTRDRFTKALPLFRHTRGKGWDFTGIKYGIWLEIKPTAKYSERQECRYIRENEWKDTDRYIQKVPSYYIEGAISQGMVIPEGETWD